MKNSPYILFISGPTASGKTDFSLELAKKLGQQNMPAQIINADIGQFYKPFSIGTAKPDWKSMPVEHHLFDIVEEPKDFNVVAYRKLLLKKVEELWNKGILPIVVGGSLFYIRSLFFPPLEGGPFLPLGGNPSTGSGRTAKFESCLWEKLHAIDPERAKAILPGDTYRIQRALAIWEATGKKPSECEPVFDPGFHARIIFLNPDRQILYERINKRTELMLGTLGLVDEVRHLKGTEWEPFLKMKKLIGYPEIFAWLDLPEDEQKEKFGALVQDIQRKTRNYAKRQVTFWKKFRTLCTEAVGACEWQCCTQTVTVGDVDSVVINVKDDIKKLNEKGDR